MKILFTITALSLLLVATSAVTAQQGIGQQSTTTPRSPSVVILVKPGGGSSPMTPERQEQMQEERELCQEAGRDLHAGRPAQAEALSRQIISLNDENSEAKEVLAASLDAQGKDQEALRAYKIMVVDEKAEYPRVLLPYAQLLLNSGQWAQAIAVYNQALPLLPDVGPHPETPIVHDGDQIRANSHFSPDVPEPAALAVALHITRGMVLNVTPSWAGGASQAKEAMAEYEKALQLAPGNALANYYYGVGWHKLSPTERVEFGHAAQAKAALQKAALSDDPNVKKMAAETLKKSN